MSVRTTPASAGRARRREEENVRAQRAGAVTGRGKRRTEEPARAQRRKSAPLMIESGEGKKSTAARRAYEKRQQRAALVLGDDVAPGVLPKRATEFAARIPFVATIIGLLSMGLALTLLLTTRSAEESYEISAAREQNQRLMEERATLQRDVQSADSAPDLAAKARELGMIPAKDPARLLVAPDGAVIVVGTPTPAAGAPAPLLNGRTPARVSAPAPVRTPAAVPIQPVAPTRATPQPSNGPQVQAQGEQLMPMTISVQPPAGGPR